MQSKRRQKGKRGETLSTYLTVEDAAEIRLRARVTNSTPAEEIRRAVRFWLSDAREEEALQGEPEGRR